MLKDMSIFNVNRYCSNMQISLFTVHSSYSPFGWHFNQIFPNLMHRKEYLNVALICISSSFLKNDLYFKKNVCLCRSVCMCLCVRRCLKRSEASDPLTLVLQAVVRPDTGAIPLSYLSSPLICISSMSLINAPPPVPVCFYIFEPFGIYFETRTLYCLINEDLCMAKINITNCQVQNQNYSQIK